MMYEMSLRLLVVVDRILWICNDTWPHLGFDKWVLSQAVWHLKVKNRSPRLNNFQLLTFCPSAKVLSCFTKSKVYNDTKLVTKNFRPRLCPKLIYILLFESLLFMNCKIILVWLKAAKVETQAKITFKGLNQNSTFCICISNYTTGVTVHFLEPLKIRSHTQS